MQTIKSKRKPMIKQIDKLAVLEKSLIDIAFDLNKRITELQKSIVNIDETIEKNHLCVKALKNKVDIIVMYLNQFGKGEKVIK